MARAGYVPARGDFVRVVLDPRVGREQSGERPALVLSDREFNDLTGYIFAAPITSNARGWPFEVPIPSGGRVGKDRIDRRAGLAVDQDHAGAFRREVPVAPGQQRNDDGTKIAGRNSVASSTCIGARGCTAREIARSEFSDQRWRRRSNSRRCAAN